MRHDYQESGGFDLKPGDLIYVCPSKWFDPIIEYRVLGVTGGKITLRDDRIFELSLPIMNYSLDLTVVAKEKRRQLRIAIRDLQKIATEDQTAVDKAKLMLKEMK